MSTASTAPGADPVLPPARSAGTTRAFLLLFASFVLWNLLFFAGYRCFFLASFAGEADASSWSRVAAAGARLDVALLAFELSAIGLLAVASGRLSFRNSAMALGSLTLVHMIGSIASVYCYQERGQQLGELLVPYVTQPKLVYMAVAPFVISHVVLVVATLAGAAALLFAAIRLRRRLPPFEVRLWATAPRCVLALGLSCVPLLAALELVTVKRTNRESGWSLKFTHSKFYALFPGFILNQAVENPIHETFRVYLPAALKGSRPFAFTEERALEIVRSALGRRSGDGRFPLYTTAASDVDLGLENVVIVQIEGLASAVFERVEEGRQVMPYLKRLAEEGLFFPNAFQSFNATSGSVFATATGFPRGCFEEVTHRFTTYEMKGLYGSLPRLLEGGDYSHYFCLASRHSAQDFPAFFRSQGYEALGYAELSGRNSKRRRSADAEDDLGVVDGAFLDECAEILLECPRKVTLHAVTNTSHSPWKTPGSFARRFENSYYNVFSYVDASIEAFMEKLKKSYGRFDRTLFVIVADHTSVMIGDGLLERLRIPLIFWSSRIGSLKKERALALDAVASHVDIIPTILWLLGGERAYSAVGRSLLDPMAPRAPGIASATCFSAYYLTDDFVLQYAPERGETRLFARRGGEVFQNDLAAERADVLATLREELLAEYDIAKRLGMERRVWPARAESQ